MDQVRLDEPHDVPSRVDQIGVALGLELSTAQRMTLTQIVLDIQICERRRQVKELRNEANPARTYWKLVAGRWWN